MIQQPPQPARAASGVASCLFLAALLAPPAAAQPKDKPAERHWPDSGELKLYDGAGTAMDRPYDFPGVEEIRSEATGFFRTEEIDGKWWFIDPNDRGYWYAGMNGVMFGKRGFGKGAEEDRLGTKAVFGTPEAYVASVRENLRKAGFNGIVTNAMDPLVAPLPTVRILSQRGFHGWQSDGHLGHKLHENPGWHDVSNPYHPNFAAWCEEDARISVAPFKDSPWLIGYQLDNELDWYGAGTAVKVLAHEPGHHAKIALVRMAEEHFGGIEAWNAAWESDHASFDALLQSTSTPGYPPTPEAAEFVSPFASR